MSPSKSCGGLTPKVLLGVFVLIFTIISTPLLWAKIRIVSPPSKTYIRVGKVLLTGVVEGSKVKWVEISGVKVSGKAKVPVKEGGFSAAVTLSRGMNTITVKSGNEKVVIKVFYLASPKDKRLIPKGFKAFYMHKYSGTLSCGKCHRVGKVGPRSIIPTPANCSTGACHSNMGKAKHVHGPVGASVCICCHNPHGSYMPKELEREGGDLCYACHTAKKKEFSKEVVHPPVEDGDCTSCHDPHQSSLRFQLRGKSLEDLCFQCHDSSIVKHRFLHGPVGAGDCVACHKPHASDHEYLLIENPEKGALCFVCHKQRKKEFRRKFVHKPVAEDCGKCHDPHGSDFKAQLVKKEADLCRSCHLKLNPKVYSDISKAKYPHKPVKEGDCTHCHTPHSSNFRSQLKASLPGLCFNCHRELRDYIKSCKYYHGPVKDGDCDACHKPHGSLYSKLLNKYFPPEFYTPYSPKKYDLCFECHNRDIARDKRTTTLTDFRNGDFNLHYFHVHRTKGRSCKACHDPHASSQPKHIRTEVPFGAWSYPIKFTKTKTGGGCVVGCHRPYRYDRVKPVKY